jgi:hypothetical protein
MKFNKEYIIIISILGSILIYSYYYYAIKNSKIVNQLWGNITKNKNLLKTYYLSMFLSFIGFLFLFYYLLTNNNFTQTNINTIFISLLFIVIISMFWMPLSLYYLKNNNELIKYLILFVLFIVAFSSFILLRTLFNINDNKNKIVYILAITGMTYFFIHTFFFDFILWSYNFFNQ